jgi:hypothetical protein|tara:strand:+ start:114 stop:437 length:324 start_codon:yes stop_codon:yes gene_type:complete
MAQDFTNFKARNVGTSAVTLVTANSNDCTIGFRVCNVASTAIKVTIFITSGGADYHLQFNSPIPVGGSMEVTSSSKFDFSNGDVLKIKSDTASSLDVWGSIIDAISA